MLDFHKGHDTTLEMSRSPKKSLPKRFAWATYYLVVLLKVSGYFILFSSRLLSIKLFSKISTTLPPTVQLLQLLQVCCRQCVSGENLWTQHPRLHYSASFVLGNENSSRRQHIPEPTLIQILSIFCLKKKILTDAPTQLLSPPPPTPS